MSIVNEDFINKVNTYIISEYKGINYEKNTKHKNNMCPICGTNDFSYKLGDSGKPIFRCHKGCENRDVWESISSQYIEAVRRGWEPEKIELPEPAPKKEKNQEIKESIERASVYLNQCVIENLKESEEARSHAYVVKKRLPELIEDDLIMYNHQDENIVFPLYRFGYDEPVSYQTIDQDGNKLFMERGVTKGSFFKIDNENFSGKQKIAVCEGIATGYAAKRLSNKSVVYCAMSRQFIIDVVNEIINGLTQKYVNKGLRLHIDVYIDNDNQADPDSDKQKGFDKFMEELKELCDANRTVNVVIPNNKGDDMWDLWNEERYIDRKPYSFGLKLNGHATRASESTSDSDKEVISSQLVGDMLPVGTMGMFFGETGTFKSFLMVDLIASIVRGTEFMGRSTKQGKVLYCAGEGEDDFRKRIDGYKAQKGIKKSELENLFISEKKINMSDHKLVREYAQELIDNIGSVDLVVVDTFSQHSMGIEENSNTEVSTGLSILQSEFKAVNPEIVIIIVHHSSNKGEAGARKTARGASAFDANIDFVFELNLLREDNTSARPRKTKNGMNIIQVENKKAKGGEKIDAFKFTNEVYRFKNRKTDHGKFETTLVPVFMPEDHIELQVGDKNGRSLSDKQAEIVNIVNRMPNKEASIEEIRNEMLKTHKQKSNAIKGLKRSLTECHANGYLKYLNTGAYEDHVEHKIAPGDLERLTADQSEIDRIKKIEEDMEAVRKMQEEMPTE